MSASTPQVRANIAQMSGYQPGEQPARGERVIKLNTNENPYPPSPRVLEVFRNAAAEDLRRYPDPVANPLRAVVARMHGLSIEQVIAGNGSDDILNIALRAYLNAGDLLAYPSPTYSLYPVLAGLQDAKVAAVPWNSGWQLPVDALVATGAKAIFFANPNAPSGTRVEAAQVRPLAAGFAGLILIDEAYAEFSDGNCLELLREFPNVLIARTLSKSYALAGLRFGYAMGDRAVIAELMKVKDSYNCDALSIAAAVAALEDQEYARANWEKIRSERGRLTGKLAALGFQVVPSQTNFLFARPPGGNGKDVYLSLKKKGVLVRHFDGPGLSDHIRITVGTPEQDDALLEALAAG